MQKITPTSLFLFNLITSFFDYIPNRYFNSVYLEVSINFGFAKLLAWIFLGILLIFKRPKNKYINTIILLSVIFFTIKYSLPLLAFVNQNSKGHYSCAESNEFLFLNLQGINQERELKTLEGVNKNTKLVLALFSAKEQFASLKGQFPYHLLKEFSAGKFAAIFSAYPFTKNRVDSVEVEGERVLMQEILTPDNKKIMTGVIDADDPRSSEALINKRVTFRRVAGFLQLETEDVIFAGNFAATIYSPLYSAIKNGGKLTDYRAGTGFIKNFLDIDNFLPLTKDHLFYRSSSESNECGLFK